MSTIPSLHRSPAAATTAPRESKQPQTSAAPAHPKDSATLSSEATNPGETGSLPSFAAARVGTPRSRTTPTRELPHRMPKSETPEQKKAREKRNLKRVDDIERDMQRRWKAHGGGIMKPTPGSPESRPTKLKASDLPHRMPKTETPEQKQARLDRECGALRELHRKHAREARPILSEPGRAR